MTQTVTGKGFATEADEELILTDLQAAWCDPYRIQAPILEQLSKEHGEDKAKTVKMDVNENPVILTGFGIISILTLLLKEDGGIIEKAVGVHTKDQLQAMIARHL